VEGKAKNVILLIGDGMGKEHVKVGAIHKGEPLVMQGFPYCVDIETVNYSGGVTDSSAAATAMATGVRTLNNYVGLDKNEKELETIIDIAAAAGKATGVITTEYLYGATPMGFAAHFPDRNRQPFLLDSALSSSNVNLFISDRFGTYRNKFEENGYRLILNEADKISEASETKVAALSKINPQAKSMSDDPVGVAFDRLVTEALEYLSKDPDGFFLMAEGAHIDHGGHANDISYMLRELISFDDGIKAVLKWAKGRNDTVVIVTADHETGGLNTKEGLEKDNILSMVSLDGGMTYVPEFLEWTSKSHTNRDVYCYVNGADVDFSQYSFASNTRIKNSDLFSIMKSFI
jgi:alkaline phosphatase